MSDREKLNLLTKVINTAWEAEPPEGDAAAHYWRAIAITMEVILVTDDE